MAAIEEVIKSNQEIIQRAAIILSHAEKMLFDNKDDCIGFDDQLQWITAACDISDTWLMIAIRLSEQGEK